MADKRTREPDTTLGQLARPAGWTRAGIVAERVAICFWPAWTLLLAGIWPFLFEFHKLVPPDVVVGAVAVWLALVAWLFVRGARGFRLPSGDEALARMDANLPNAPIAALKDSMAIGGGDNGAEIVWQTHIRRMAAQALKARIVWPDLRLSRRDPYALRLLATTALVAGLVFGTYLQPDQGSTATGGDGGVPIAAVAWEGWIEPPSYTGKPTLYLNDIAKASILVPKGSRVTLRLYGDTDTIDVIQSVSGPGNAPPPEKATALNFQVDQAGVIAIDGDGGRSWQIALSPDGAPMVDFNGTMRRRANGEMQQPFTGSDDYGVVAGVAIISLDAGRVARRHGLVADPDPRPEVLLDLPLPISGDRANFDELLIDNLSEHPWVGLPVQIRLSVDDALGQEGLSDLMRTDLPGLRFFDPLAKAVVEQRRDLLWARENGARVSQMLRAVSHRPSDVFRDTSGYVNLMAALKALDSALAEGLTPEEQDELAGQLWDVALQIEFGDLNDAYERLQRAQDRLEEAMRNGASDEEIAELMRELQEAMRDYIRQLAQQSEPGDGATREQADNGQSQNEITGQQLQDMLDEIQRLMEEGRMAEAMQLMEQLRQMMENMQVTQGQGGQQNPGQEAMEGLADTLRQQQGLSDQAFRDLQEQFNPNSQAGRSGQNEGRSGGEGRGQNHGDPQNPQGEGGQDGQSAEGLADRQRALRDMLRQQQQNLPGVGGEAGRNARDALDRAGRSFRTGGDRGTCPCDRCGVRRRPSAPGRRDGRRRV